MIFPPKPAFCITSYIVTLLLRPLSLTGELEQTLTDPEIVHILGQIMLSVTAVEVSSGGMGASEERFCPLIFSPGS